MPMSLRTVAFAALVSLAASALAAEEALVLQHNGRLLDAQDQPVSGTYTLTFRIYAQGQKPAGQDETPLWEASYEVQATQGIYSVPLGLATGGRPPLGTSLFPAGAERWLSIAVNRGAELSPRLRLGTVPSAMRAAVADLATKALDAQAVGGKSLAELDARYAPAAGGGYAQLRGALDAEPQDGHVAITGTVRASAFTGSGAGLTQLDSAALTGTVASDRISGNYSRAVDFTNTGNHFAGTHTGAFDGTHTGAFEGTHTGTFDGTHTGTFGGTHTGSAAFESLRIPVSAAAAGCGAAQKGAVYFDATEGALKVCDGSGWKLAYARPAKLEWIPSRLDFDTLASPSSTITLRNDGDEAISGLGILTAGGFGLTHSCGSSLAARSSCAVTLAMPAAAVAGTRVTGTATASGSGVAAVSVELAGTAPAAATCKAIKALAPASKDGVYRVDPDGRNGEAAVDVYCDMTTDGGGWTLAAYCGQLPPPQNFFDLRCGGGSYSPNARTGCASLPSVSLARASTEMAMARSDANATSGNILAYSAAWKIGIPDPSSVNFVNHSRHGPYTGTGANDRGPCVQATVAALKGATPDGPRYFFKHSLGVSWDDSYPTGYGVNPNSSCQGTWTKGPFFVSVNSGSGGPNPGSYSNACVSGGRPEYQHLGWFDANDSSKGGSTSIWFR